MLPVMGGLELTKLIKKASTSDVIVMTGYSDNYSYEEAINIGASDFVIKPVRLGELMLRLKRVLKERELTNERIRMMEKLQELAITDGLTKLYNSRSFYAQLELEIDRSNRYQHPLTLLLLDIDHFKEYNDKFGHLEGDKVLVGFSRIITSCLRTNDSAYRYGGEEFTVILPETAGEESENGCPANSSGIGGRAIFTGRRRNSDGHHQYRRYRIPPQRSVVYLHSASRSGNYRSKRNGRNMVSMLYADTSPEKAAKS